MKSIRTAIFGTGFMGRVHLEAVRRVESVEAAAIAGETSRPRDSSGRGLLDLLRLRPTIARSCAIPTIDAVHICTPNAQHFPMAKDAHRGRQARALRKAAGHQR